MYQKIKAKFKANPTIFYACSIVASWAGVGSLMNFRTLAINNGAAAAIIWAVFNSLACIFFGLFAEYIPTVRRIMQSKVMFYFIGFLTVFQTWTQMSGIYEIFGDTPTGKRTCSPSRSGKSARRAASKTSVRQARTFSRLRC